MVPFVMFDAADLLLQCPMDDAFLVKFLRCRKYRVDATFNTIRKYFRAKQDQPELFRGLLPGCFNYDLIVRKNRLMMLLEEKDSHGRAVAWVKLGEYQSELYAKHLGGRVVCSAVLTKQRRN